MAGNKTDSSKTSMFTSEMQTDMGLYLVIQHNNKMNYVKDVRLAKLSLSSTENLHPNKSTIHQRVSEGTKLKSQCYKIEKDCAF